MLFINDPIVVVVPEQPVVESAIVADFFQKVRQLIWLEIGINLLLNCCRRAVCDDVINLPVQSFQRLLGFGIFLAGRQFFQPPRNMVDAELSAIAAHGIVSLIKIWAVHIQNAVCNVVALCAAHCEERAALQLKRLPAHQMDDVWADFMHLSTVP